MSEHKVAAEKVELVKQLRELMDEYPVVALVNLANLPAPQLQVMRAKLRDSVVMVTAKKRLMRIALEGAKDKKPGIEQLSDKMKGMPSLVFTKDNPFKLAGILRENKSKAPAKAGQEAPNDIIVPAGATPFSPGPVISELGSIGLKTGVEGGKVAIKEDSVVAKEGDVIDQNMANVLAKLEIHPMEIGLDLTAAYEDGTIFGKDVLSVDPQIYRDELTAAIAESHALTMGIGYITDANAEALVQKAFREALGLAIDKEVLSDELLKKQVGDAYVQMKALMGKASISEDAAEEPKEDPEPEEPKEEPKEEAKPEPTPEAPAEEPKEEPAAESEKVEETPAEPEPEPKEEATPEPAPEEPKEEAAPEPEKVEEPQPEAEPEPEKVEEPAPEEVKEEATPEPTPEEPKEAEPKEEAPEVPESEHDASEAEPELPPEREAPAPEQVQAPVEPEKVEEKPAVAPEAAKEIDSAVKDAQEFSQKQVDKIEDEIDQQIEEMRVKKDDDVSTDQDKIEELTKKLQKKGTLRD